VCKFGYFRLGVPLSLVTPAAANDQDDFIIIPDGDGDRRDRGGRTDRSTVLLLTRSLSACVIVGALGGDFEDVLK